MHAVDKVDVRVPRRAVHGRVPLRAPAAGVAGLVLLADVGLDLNDAPREPRAIQHAHQPLPQEIPGDGQGIAGEEIPV